MLDADPAGAGHRLNDSRTALIACTGSYSGGGLCGPISMLASRSDCAAMPGWVTFRRTGTRPDAAGRESAMRKISALVLCPGLSCAGTFGLAQTPPSGMTCPGDKLVWVNTRSHVYHFQGERYFGSTKQGKFICERDADREGDRPTRNGQ